MYGCDLRWCGVTLFGTRDRGGNSDLSIVSDVRLVLVFGLLATFMFYGLGRGCHPFSYDVGHNQYQMKII